MVFSSFIFVFYFLPVALLFYFVTPRIGKNLILLILSLLFYSWGEPKFIFFLLICCGLDYIIALLISHFQANKRQNRARQLLILGLTINICTLVYFKYTGFFLGEANRVFELFGIETVKWTKIILPLGVSFFTFHKISYLVDVYRMIRPATKSPIDFALYIMFFPQLIAGPIVRYHEIEDQIKSRKASFEDLYVGLKRFAIGLAKKVLIADVVGHTADAIFGMPHNSLRPELAWLGMFAYTAQIYFDFSGYSDMAIGLARMFGFKFPENFNHPYLATSFTDFWRRWHTSFGRWMREYLYYPLGGSRKGVFRGYVNLWIVFLFSGFWHGAEWTFLLWGIFHGVFMTLDKLFLLRWLEKVPIFVATLTTLFFVALSRVLFRADTVGEALLYYRQLFIPIPSTKYIPWGQLTSPHELTVLAIAYVIALYRLIPRAEKYLEYFKHPFLRDLVALVLFALSICAMAGTDFSPFIYFQF